MSPLCCRCLDNADGVNDCVEIVTVYITSQGIHVHVSLLWFISDRNLTRGAEQFRRKICIGGGGKGPPLPPPPPQGIPDC